MPSWIIWSVLECKGVSFLALEHRTVGSRLYFVWFGDGW